MDENPELNDDNIVDEEHVNESIIKPQTFATLKRKSIEFGLRFK